MRVAISMLPIEFATQKEDSFLVNYNPYTFYLISLKIEDKLQEYYEGLEREKREKEGSFDIESSN